MGHFLEAVGFRVEIGLEATDLGEQLRSFFLVGGDQLVLLVLLCGEVQLGLGEEVFVELVQFQLVGLGLLEVVLVFDVTVFLQGLVEEGKLVVFGAGFDKLVS